MMLKKIIKPVFKCSPDFKVHFPVSKALVTISVGQEVHEGEKFESTIQLINNVFDHITILVDDVLQRHSMSLVSSASDDELYQISLEEGDLWLERNKSLYNQLSTPYNIIRWEKWLHHAKYQQTHESIKTLYLNDPVYKHSIDTTAQTFLERFVRRQPKLAKDPKAAFNCCLEYLFEECAALCLWVEDGYHFEVYPSQRNAAMTMTHSMLIEPKYPNLLWPIAIKFKNRKQLKAQSLGNTVEQEATHVA